ncbi:15126_t:CDS:2, partial [Acaulospora colombiana]
MDSLLSSVPNYLYKIIDNEYKPFTNKLALPDCWNDDFNDYTEVINNGLRVKYIGPGLFDSEAECVVADKHIPRDVLLYYFEIDIIDKGISALELSKRTVTATFYQVRWVFGSLGYHGDDGHRFFGRGLGNLYGPKFTSGDTIGCCVNFLNNQVFFTKNGINL